MIAVAPRPTVALSPYKGLAPFEDSEVDASFFFGRDREQEIITANLTAARLTLLYGASGVGKSSVLKAGVVRRLRGLPGPLAVVVFDHWREDPGARLREAVADVAGVRAEGSLADTLEAATAHLGGELYVILDGAEEYFVYHAGEQEPGSFAFDFPDAVARAGLPAYFLLSLREDSLAALDRFKPRIPSLFANSLRLDHLDREAAREAIVGPLEEFNRVTPDASFEIEPELVEAVLEQVASGRVDVGLTGRGVANGARAAAGYVETPYLSLVMERLWAAEREAGSDLLRLRTLDGLGGAEQIVRDHLDDALNALPPDEQEAAAEMFNHLVTPSGTKIAHRASDLARYADVDETELEPTLRALTTERILRPVAASDGSSRYEIFHDVLANAVLAWRTRHEANRRLEAERAAAARRQRRVVAGAAVAAAVIAVLAAATVYALVQRSDARTQATRAEARELVARSATALPVDPVGSVRFAAHGARLEPSRQTTEMLRTTLADLRLDAIVAMHAPVATVQFSPDSRMLAVAAGSVARLVSVGDHRLRRTLHHGARVTGAWFDPGGRLILTTGTDGVARAWDPSTGQLLYLLHHGGRINSANFSRDGRVVATASEDHTVRLWRVSDGRLLHVLRHPQPVITTSFDGAGRLLATASTDTTARIFDVRTGRLVFRLHQPGSVADVAFAQQAPIVATAGADKVARIWNARTGQLRFELIGHAGRVLDVDFDPSGERLVTASADQSAYVWDVRTGHLLATAYGDTNQVRHARFSPDGATFVTASSDRTARVFDKSGWQRSALAGHGDTVKDAVFSPDGETVATASTDGTARLWSWRSQPNLRLLDRGAGPVAAVAFSRRYGDRLISVADDGRVRAWPKGVGFATSFASPSPIRSIAFGAGRRWILVANADGVARLWRAPGVLIERFRERYPITDVALARDGRVATTDARNRVLLWNRGTHRVDHAFRAGSHVADLAFSPHGRFLATAGVDGTARVWNTRTGTLVRVLRGHRKALTAAAFSPNGKFLVTTSMDQDARLWNVATGRTRHVLRVHWGSVQDAAFTADGRWVATAGGGGVGIFDAATGRILFLVRTRDALPLKIATSSSGWRVGVGGTDGYVETYDCRLCAGRAGLLSLASKRLSLLDAGVASNRSFAQR